MTFFEDNLSLVVLGHSNSEVKIKIISNNMNEDLEPTSFLNSLVKMSFKTQTGNLVVKSVFDHCL